MEYLKKNVPFRLYADPPRKQTLNGRICIKTLFKLSWKHKAREGQLAT